MGIGEVDGHGHQGGSTWQSVTRGTGNVETDYLNGEIVLLGRTLGISTPYNALVQLLTRVTVTGGHEPGWRSARELIAEADGRTRTVLD
jgi:2-dehydropantoate 2-reductase